MKIIQYQESYSEKIKKRLGKILLVLLAIGVPILVIIFFSNKIFSNPIYILGTVLLCVIALRILYSFFDNIVDNYRNARLGAAGESAVREELLKFLDDSYVYIANYVIPGTKIGDIDVIIIGPKGLFIVEVKNWEGRFRISGTDIYRHLKKDIFKIYRKNFFYQTKRQAEYLKKYLREKEINIDPSIIITLVDGKIEAIIGQIGSGVFVCEVNKLVNHIFESAIKPEFTKDFIDRIVRIIVGDKK